MIRCPSRRAPFLTSLLLLTQVLVGCEAIGPALSALERPESREASPATVVDPADRRGNASPDTAMSSTAASNAKNAQGTQGAGSVAAETARWEFKRRDGGYREGIFEIEVAAGGWASYGVEVSAGDAVVYYWSSISPESDTLGSRLLVRGEAGTDKMEVLNEELQSAGQGLVKAPTAGRIWWQFKNSGSEPLRLLLRIAGFYRKLPEAERPLPIPAS